MSLTIQITKRPNVHPDELYGIIRRALDESVRVLEKNVRDRTPIGVGGESGLKGSIFSEVKEFGTFMTALTSSPLPHAAPVEFGRSAGRKPPPVKALIPWVERFIPLRKGQTAKGVAFAIARYMGLRGSRSWRQSPPGVRMFERGAEASWPLVQKIFQDQLRGGAVKLITN